MRSACTQDFDVEKKVKGEHISEELGIGDARAMQ
jgi:hypothetical protein